MTKDEISQAFIEGYMKGYTAAINEQKSDKKELLDMTKDIYKVCPSQKELDAKDRALEHPVQEPVDVARVQEDGYVEWRPNIPDLPVGTKLYTHPAQSRQPLSDEAIEELEAQFTVYWTDGTGHYFDYKAFARAIEKRILAR